MKYMGSKSRIARQILSIVLRNRQPDQWYVEPFCGGCNVIDKVTGNRIANDSNPYLIAMWKSLVEDGWKPEAIDEERHKHIRDFKDHYDPKLVGWAGFMCSFRGIFFGGFAGKCKTKTGTIRDYQMESFVHIMKQVHKLGNVIFTHGEYFDIKLYPNSIIYCDPPYMDTHGYADVIDQHQFWNWVREKTMEDHFVYVSEYKAPDDFECVYETSVRCLLGITTDKKNIPGGVTYRTERLFRYKHADWEKTRYTTKKLGLV